MPAFPRRVRVGARRVGLALLSGILLSTGLSALAPERAAAAPGPFYYLVAVHSGKPIMPENHSYTWGTALVQADWQNGGALHWSTERAPYTTLRLFRNRWSKWCLQIPGLAPGAAIQAGCTIDGYSWWVPSASDLWAGRPVTLRNERSNLCLDVAGASTAAGAPVTQYPCHGGDNQKFRLEHVPAPEEGGLPMRVTRPPLLALRI